MFGFKKKAAKPVEVSNVQEPTVDVDQLQKVKLELEDGLSSRTGDERIGILNQLGSCCYQLQDYDKAIEFYEMSLAECSKLGKAHTDLMKLYNVKRREAAEQKDSAAVQLYMDKIDQLTNLSKVSMRQGNF